MQGFQQQLPGKRYGKAGQRSGKGQQEAAQDAALIPQRIQQALQKPDAHHAQREHGANLFYSGQCAAQQCQRQTALHAAVSSTGQQDNTKRRSKQGAHRGVHISSCIGGIGGKQPKQCRCGQAGADSISDARAAGCDLRQGKQGRSRRSQRQRSDKQYIRFPVLGGGQRKQGVQPRQALRVCLMGQAAGGIPHGKTVLVKYTFEVDTPMAEFIPGLEFRLPDGEHRHQHPGSAAKGQHTRGEQLG